jgi:perosamine synthetase
MTKKISFAGPWITQKEIDLVMDAVKNGWYEDYTKHTQLLEQYVKDYLGVKYAIGTHCCTLALHLAACSIGLQKGDEVIVPDHSWIATAYSITYAGATCIFVDIDPQALCISPKAIEEAITSKTKAIMLVHNFGLPADMDAIMSIAQKHNLKVIEDAAPAMGSLYKGKKTGTFGDVACFSFQGAKIAVAGEGGIMVTNNEEIYNKAVLFANMGRTDRIAPFWSDQIGFQYTISNLSASLAYAQMQRIDELKSKKRQIYTWYKERLKNHPKITMIKELDDSNANYCYPSLFLSEETKTSRDRILEVFRQHNIHARPGFPRMSQFPVYKQYCKFDNKIAKKFEQYGLVLPSAANLEEKDVEFVSKLLLKLID